MSLWPPEARNPADRAAAQRKLRLLLSVPPALSDGGTEETNQYCGRMGAYAGGQVIGASCGGTAARAAAHNQIGDFAIQGIRTAASGFFVYDGGMGTAVLLQPPKQCAVARVRSPSCGCSESFLARNDSPASFAGRRFATTRDYCPPAAARPSGPHTPSTNLTRKTNPAHTKVSRCGRGKDQTQRAFCSAE